MTEFLSVQQAAERLHVCNRTLIDWLREGKLKGSKPGRKWLITEEDLAALETKANMDLGIRKEIVEKALQQHLDEIRDLVEQWKVSISTPEIFQVSSDFSNTTCPFGKRRLFGSLRDHLPFSDLWQDYDDYKAKRGEYVDTCKKLAREIRESWGIEGVDAALGFEKPVLRLISRQGKELQYKLFVIEGHDPAEPTYQLLLANDAVVLEGRDTKTRHFTSLEHEECKGEILPTEYQRIAELFLRSNIASEAKRLLADLRGLEDTIHGSLEEILLRRDYIGHICKLCPGQPKM